MSMVADGYHSLIDGANNVVGLVVTHLAYAPPDAGHPYGHRKFETAATLAIGLALLGLAYQVIEEALRPRRRHPAARGGPPQLGGHGWAPWWSTCSWPATRPARAAGCGSPYLQADAAHTRRTST